MGCEKQKLVSVLVEVVFGGLVGDCGLSCVSICGCEWRTALCTLITFYACESTTSKDFQDVFFMEKCVQAIFVEVNW